MTELETLERAKLYMEKLANGINPLDGTMIPDEDVVNNVRLSRCFFYVADVLRQVIGNGGILPEKKPAKAPFSLPMEKRSAFMFSNAPIPVSELAKRINALAEEENMSRLSYSVIRDWLISLEMLEEVPDGNGKTMKRPTPQGESIGILMESRIGSSGTYFVVLYSLDAQHFVLDNLDAVIEFGSTRKENQGQPWTSEQDQYLVERYRMNVPVREIAVALRRNPSAVRKRLKNLGIALQD